MTLTGHAVVGAMLAAKIQDPVILGTVGIVSHYALDVLPHWDFGTHFDKKSKRRLVVESYLDVGVGWSLAYFLYFSFLGGDSLFLLVFGVLASQAPDWVTAPYHFLKWRFPPFTWAEQVSDVLHVKLDAPWGVVTQIAAVGVVYYLLFVL